MKKIMLTMMSSGKIIMLVDCNNCKYLSCTEEEQNNIRHALNITAVHTCTKYNRRVFHNHNSFIEGKNHNSYLYPCDECIEKPEYMEVE